MMLPRSEETKMYLPHIYVNIYVYNNQHPFILLMYSYEVGDKGRYGMVQFYQLFTNNADTITGTAPKTDRQQTAVSFQPIPITCDDFVTIRIFEADNNAPNVLPIVYLQLPCEGLYFPS